MSKGKVSFVVTNPDAMFEAVDPGVGAVARELAGAASAGTPRRFGALAAGWTVNRSGNGRYGVINTVPYGRFVEYGTRHMRAASMMGRAAAVLRGRHGG